MKPYFEIDELELWLIRYIDLNKYQITNCYNFVTIETEKNSKYWIELYSTGKLELKVNHYRKDDNSDKLLGNLINTLLDENLLISWNENQKYGYLLKDKNNLLGLINVLFQTNIELKEEIENLRKDIRELEYKSHSHSDDGSIY